MFPSPLRDLVTETITQIREKTDLFTSPLGGVVTETSSGNRATSRRFPSPLRDLVTETPLFVSGYVLWFPSPLSGVVTETSRHHGRRSELLFPSPHSKRKECAFRPGRNDEAGIRR